MSYREVLQAALDLGIKDRNKLVKKLQASLEDDDAPILSEEWMAEIERRTAEYEAGKAEWLTWDQVKRRLRRMRPKHAQK